jgi:hypothetical protein
VLPFKLRNLRDAEDKHILIWSAIFSLNFLGGRRDRTLRTAKQDRCGLLWPARFPPLLGGGLEPAFRVLFSAIFHEFRSGISIGVENYGIERKQNCSFFVVKLLTKFSCVLAIVCLPQ